MTADMPHSLPPLLTRSASGRKNGGCSRGRRKQRSHILRPPPVPWCTASCRARHGRVNSYWSILCPLKWSNVRQSSNGAAHCQWQTALAAKEPSSLSRLFYCRWPHLLSGRSRPGAAMCLVTLPAYWGGLNCKDHCGTQIGAWGGKANWQGHPRRTWLGLSSPLA